MNNLKFRGNRTLTGELIYGAGIVIISPTFINIQLTKYVTPDDCVITLAQVIPASAAQFIGLCDMAGKEIYSNDILAPFGNITQRPNIDECFAVKFENGSYNVGKESDTDYYIIGNAYQNPELLQMIAERNH